MSNAPWRCFVAVPLSDELRATLLRAVDRWRTREELAGLRWADPDSWHVTLAFLDAVERTRLHLVRVAMESAAARAEAWRTSTGGLGAFPSPARARVAWYGISDSNGRLGTLAADLAAALGTDPAGRYHPHVTLARARGNAVDVRTWIHDGSAPRGHLNVERLELRRSHLGRGPARYETLASAPLGGTSRV